MTNILIVEDDLDLIETYTDFLEAKSFNVASVLRASHAIQHISTRKPDIVILDLNLPGESGEIVISFVRSYKPLAKLKIIVATGHPEKIQKSSYIRSKVDAILTKPISNEMLLKQINSCLAPQSQ
jgi:DNA-binding response OmpR family regulator